MARVLVADDTEFLLTLVSSFLASVGHDVVRARDGGEARAILDKGDVDILVTDLEMPVLNGMELLVHARSLPRPIPVFIVSGSLTPGDRQRARALGAAGVYAKPLDLHDLARDLPSPATAGGNTS